MIIATGLLLVGCSSASGPDYVKAIVRQSTEATKLDIQQAVSQALNGQSIKLADNVLSNRSILYIERKQQSDRQGIPVNGRHNERAISFTLLLSNKRCFLRQDATGDVIILKNLQCQPENSLSAKPQ